MARTVNMEVLEQKISKAEQEVVKAKKNYDIATASLKKLLDKRDAIRSRELMKVVTDSPLSYDEIITLIRSAGKSKAEE